jgi:ribosome-binding ATPase YchF (GTP1/OBG family)
MCVVRNFRGPVGSDPSPVEDFWQIEEEMILNDLVVAEKRIERIELDTKRGNKPKGNEYALVKACREILDDGLPIRNTSALALEPELRGFTFLTAKPLLIIVNNEDEEEQGPAWHRKPENVEQVVVRGRLEQDLATMEPEEAREFREAYNIQESALDRVIQYSYRALNQISFFTVISDEVRAWNITAGTPALEAAGTVHSDMMKGFIRAEVLAYNDLEKYKTPLEAKKAGVVRLEGKDYVVKDGDIIQFRFNL